MTRSRLVLRMAISCLIVAWALVLSTMTLALSLEQLLVRRYGADMPALTRVVLDAGHWLRGDLYVGQHISGFAWIFPLLIAGTIMAIRWHARVTGSLGIALRHARETDDSAAPAPQTSARSLPATTELIADVATAVPTEDAPVLARQGAAMAAADRVAPALTIGLSAAATALIISSALALTGIVLPFIRVLV